MKKIIFIFIMCPAIVIAAVFIRDKIVMHEMRVALRSVTGFNADIGGYDWPLFSTVVRFDGIRLYNPRVFGDDVFVFIPQLTMDCDIRKSIRTKTLRVSAITLFIDYVTIVRDEVKDVNLYYVRSLTPRDAAESGRRSRALLDNIPFLAEKVIVTIRRVRFIDYSRYGTEQVFEMPVENQTFEMIHSPAWLANIVMYKIMEHVAIAQEFAINRNALMAALKNDMGDQSEQITVHQPLLRTRLLKSASTMEQDDAGRGAGVRDVRTVLHLLIQSIIQNIETTVDTMRGELNTMIEKVRGHE